MKRYKVDIKTIVEVLTFILIFLSISSIDNLILSYCMFGLWIVYWSYNFYSKIQYRKGKADYILFPTQNDQYYKATSISLGLIVLIITIVASLWTKTFNHNFIIGLVSGLLVFLNGIFDLPKGKMIVQGNSISVSGLQAEIDQRQLKEISISTDRLLLTNVNGEIQRVDNLIIDLKSAELINKYIFDNKNCIDLKVINNVVN